MATTMLVGMLLMAVAFWAYSFAVAFTRARAIVLEQEHDNEWVSQLKGPRGGRYERGGAVA
jgi:heme exporter protein C